MEKLFILLILAFLIPFVVNSPKEDWERWKRRFGKVYTSENEEEKRHSIYTNNINIIEDHNILSRTGKSTYQMKMNHFGDKLHHEFLNASASSSYPLKSSRKQRKYILEGPLPESINWVDKGAVTYVRDQGDCGSCYAFSTIGSIEGQLFINKGLTTPLSEQQILDCSRAFGNLGCDGGQLDGSMEYLIDSARGVGSEFIYPYVGKEGSCRYNKAKMLEVELKDYFVLVNGDEENLKRGVGLLGPISVAMDSSLEGFQFYHDGYGIENGEDYWLIKNSWSPLWGMNGYMKIKRNARNMCGVASFPVIPQIKV